MKRILVVGGANGIGLSLAMELIQKAETEKVYIVDKALLDEQYRCDKVKSFQFDLMSNDYSLFDQFDDIDGLIITAGFGRLALFEDIPEEMITTYMQVNSISVMRIIHHFYQKMISRDDFYCAVMVSIAGFMSSPFFSVYGASKAALKIFIESVNVELLKAGTTNQILNISPGSIKNTSFTGGKTDVSALSGLANDIINRMLKKEDLYIPQYDEIFKNVLVRYHNDFRKEGAHSYDYKLERLNSSNKTNK